MIRKGIALAILIGLIAFSTFVVWSMAIEMEEAPSSLNFIPDDAKTIIRCSTNNWPEFNNLHKFLFDKSSFPAVQQLGSYLTELDSMRLTTPLIQELLNSNEFYLSFFPKSDTEVNWMFSCGIKSKDVDLLDEFLSNNFSNTSKGSFNDISYYKGEINYLIFDDILIATSDESTIKQVINDQKDKNLDKSRMLTQAMSADGNGVMNLWTHLEGTELNSFKSKVSSPLNLTQGWISMEPMINNGIFQLMGYVFHDSSSKSSYFDHNINRPWNLMLSQNLNSEVVQMESYSEYHKSWMENATDEELSKFIGDIDLIENECSCFPEKLAFNNSNFYALLKNDERRFLVLPYADFPDLLEEYSNMFNESFDEYKGFPIFDMKYKYLYSTLLHLSDISFSNLTLVEDHFILSTRPEDLKWYLNQYLSGKTLNGKSSFIKLTEHFKPSDWYQINTTQKSNQLIFPFDLGLNNQYFSFTQFIPENDKTYIHYVEVLGEQKSISETSSISQSSDILFDNELIGQPYLLLNHYTDEKEILVQDENNKIHYLSANGTELWNAQLNDKILGNVQQIDIYKNGKLQMVFNTKNQIYCLDRNGKNVEKFPITLDLNASSEMKIFDYDNNKKYRFMIGCEDGSIKNYTTEGIATKGWDHKPVKSPITQVDHLRIKNKDYILALDSDNNVYILKRNGQIRVKSDQTLKNKVSSEVCFDGRSTLKKSKLYYINTGGQLIGQNINSDKHEIIFSGLDLEAILKLEDLNNDNKDDFVIAEKNRLIILNSDGEIIIETQFDSELDPSLKIFKFNQVDKRIGLVSSQNDEIYLIDSKGKIINNFPKNGSFQFSISDIDKDGILELVSVMQFGQVNVYKLN